MNLTCYPIVPVSDNKCAKWRSVASGCARESTSTRYNHRGQAHGAFVVCEVFRAPAQWKYDFITFKKSFNQEIQQIHYNSPANSCTSSIVTSLAMNSPTTEGCSTPILFVFHFVLGQICIFFSSLLPLAPR